MSDSLVNVDILKMLLMIVRSYPDDLEVQSSCMTIMARMVMESPEEAAKKVDENAEDELDDDDVAEEKKRRRELKKEEEKKNRGKSKKKVVEDKEVTERRAVLTELSTLDNVNLLASCVKRFPEDATLLSDTSDVLVSVCVNSEEARRFVAVSGVVTPYFDALLTTDLSLLGHVLSLMAELVKVASVKAVLHQLHPSERVISMIANHMKRLHDNTSKMQKDELARKMVCILVEMSASRELLNDFAETPGLPVIVDVQNTFISDPYIQLCIAGYLNNLMPMQGIPEQFMEAKGLPATVSSLETYLRKRTLMKMFCEVLYTLVKTYPKVSLRVSREVTPVLENCLKKNQKKMDNLEPPIRLLTYLVKEPTNVCCANDVLKCCTDIMYNNRENKEVLPPFLTITDYVLRSGRVTVDFLASGVLQFFCWLCDVYGKQPEVLGYVLGVVSAIAYLSRRSLDTLEEFKLPEIAMDSQKAFAKAELVQQHAAGILSLYSDFEEPRKVMVDRRVLVYLLRAMSNYPSNKDLVLYSLETCSNLVDEEMCLKDFTEQLGVDTALRCMLCLPQNIDAIMLSLRLCYLTFQRDPSQIDKMAREGVMAVLVYAVKNLNKSADDMASVLQMLQLICADKKCCQLALQQPFIAAFMDVHESFVGDVVINESMLCIMWYMSNYDGIAEALFHEHNFDLMPHMMTDFKRSAVIQTWTCKLLYNLSKRSDCVELLRESLITRNLLQVVNDFPRDFDILRPALRAISNLLSKEMIQQIDVAELLDVSCRVLNQYAGRKTFVLEVMDLICNLAKSLNAETAIHVRDILNPMMAVIKRFKDNEDIIVKTLLVIEMLVPADPKGKQLVEAHVLKVVMGVSDVYVKSPAVQTGVYRVVCALLRIPPFFNWMVQHMSRLMDCMRAFPQSKEVQTVCVEVLTKLCDDKDVLENLDETVLRALDALLVRFPNEQDLILATERCVLRLLSVPELCDAFITLEGAVHVLNVVKSFKDMDLLQTALQIVDVLLHKDTSYVEKLLVKNCDSLLVMLDTSAENVALLTFVAKLLCAVVHDIHSRLVVYVDDLSTVACRYAKEKGVVKYLFTLLAEVATEEDPTPLLTRMHDKGVTQATITSVAANKSSKSLIRSATSLMAALVSYPEAAAAFANSETILMLNEICNANLKKPEIALNVISVLIKLAENEMCARVMSENRIVQTTAQTLNMCRDDKDLVISCLYLLTNLIQFKNYVAFAETTLIVDCAELLQENVKYAIDNNTETVESVGAVEIVTLSLKLLCGMVAMR